jgi:uncharacterized protein with ParB-like and HNH nuclease domain
VAGSVTVSGFFSDKYLEIPKYQRGYSWEVQQINDLFDDIAESIDSDYSHYLGTVVISPAGENRYNLIDGQQRITTIIMIIDAIADTLDKDDEIFYRRTFIADGGGYKLIPSSRDREFFKGIIEGTPVESKNKAQSLLAKGYEAIKDRLEAVKDKKAVLTALTNMRFAVFEEGDQGKAIRVFLTVNDRGRPLTNIEKAKSLLIYYSNKYLEGELDDKLNDKFGDIFEAYEEIKYLGEKLGVSLIKNKEFNEDTVMRYHYITLFKDNYGPSAEAVLDSLKTKLSDYGKSDKDGIRDFLNRYIDTLTGFFQSLRELVKLTEKDVKLYKLLVVLGLSANLYPLLAALNIRGLLNRPLSSGEGTYPDILEALDVKVYKTLGRSAAKWMAAIVYDIMNAPISPEKTEKELSVYIKYYCDDASFRNSLRRDAFNNSALTYMFIAYCEHLSGESYGIDRIKDLLQAKGGPTREHILSQTPNFDPAAFGFKDKEDYGEYLNSIGNLTLLEHNLNSKAKDKVLPEKRGIYYESVFVMTKRFSAWLLEHKSFNKADMEKRGEELIDFCVERWKF